MMTSRNNTAPEDEYATKASHDLFYPETIAVIGAGNDAFKPGGRMIKNIENNGYGGQLWAVNPKARMSWGCQPFLNIN